MQHVAVKWITHLQEYRWVSDGHAAEDNHLGRLPGGERCGGGLRQRVTVGEHQRSAQSPGGGRATQRVGERGTCRAEDGLAEAAGESCKLCGRLVPVLTRPPEHGAWAREALELTLDDAAHGRGSTGDVDPGRVEPAELDADRGGKGSVLRHKKEWTALSGGNRPGGKRVREVGARYDRDGELRSQGLRLEAILRDGNRSGIPVSTGETRVGRRDHGVGRSRADT